METDNTNQPVPPVQNIEQPQSDPPANHSSHSKIFIIITSVILLTMIGVGSYVLGTRKNQAVVQDQQLIPSPTVSQSSPIPMSDKTANWKTYASIKFKYSLKYPSNWSLNETPYGSYKGRTVFLPPGDIYDNPNAGNRGIAINFYDVSEPPPPPPGNPLNQTIEPYASGYQKIRSTFFESSYHKIRSVYIKDAGFEVEVLEPKFKGAAEKYIATIRNGKYEYIFYFGSQLNRKYDSVFDQILSTFQFLN